MNLFIGDTKRLFRPRLVDKAVDAELNKPTSPFPDGMGAKTDLWTDGRVRPALGAEQDASSTCYAFLWRRWTLDDRFESGAIFFGETKGCLWASGHSGVGHAN